MAETALTAEEIAHAHLVISGYVDSSNVPVPKALFKRLLATAEQHAEMLAVFEMMERECLSLHCVDVPTGAGDADVAWRVISHHMSEPPERVEAYGKTPLAALSAAIKKEGG